MENTIKNELHEEGRLNHGHFSATRLPEKDDLQTDLQVDPENEDLLGGNPWQEPLEDEAALGDLNADNDDLDLGDADGSGGELKSDEDPED